MELVFITIMKHCLKTFWSPPYLTYPNRSSKLHHQVIGRSNGFIFLKVGRRKIELYGKGQSTTMKSFHIVVWWGFTPKVKGNLIYPRGCMEPPPKSDERVWKGWSLSSPILILLNAEMNRMSAKLPLSNLLICLQICLLSMPCP